MRAVMPRVSHRFCSSGAVVPWLLRATETRPPYAMFVSETRLKYIVISTLRQALASAGSCTYMRGVVPLIESVPLPSTAYDALPWFASNHASLGSTPVNVRAPAVSHDETQFLPPAIVGYSSFTPNRSTDAFGGASGVGTAASGLLRSLSLSTLPSTVGSVALPP